MGALEVHDDRSGISVVIPCYHTPGSLERVCQEITEHVAPLADSIELILVDDGSADDTWEKISRVSAQHEWVRGIRLSRNYGQHNALLAGLRQAIHPVVVTMDDDLQTRPSEVPRLLEALDDGVDLVYGSPISESQTPFRNFASVATKRLMSRMLGPEIDSQLSSFRVFRQRLLRGSTMANDPYISIDVLLSWATRRVAVVEVDFDERREGTSGYSFFKLLRHAFNMVTGYSTRPLRMVSATGLAISVVGFALLVFILIRFLVDPTDVEGFTFIATAISLFSGVQLLSLGVVGEYLARMHFRSMGRPAYSIRSATDPDASEADLSVER